MKTGSYHLTRSLALLVLVVTALALLPTASNAALAEPVGPDAALSAAFTYQGSLSEGGSPASGAYDFRFILYNAASGGNQVGASLMLEDVPVTAGSFSAELDFSSASFDGQARWLEVAVRPGAGIGIYNVLSPRHPVTAVPYAIYATRSPWSGLQSVPAGFADGVDNDTTYSAGAGLTLSGATFAVDTGSIPRRVTGVCAAGSAIRVVNDDGSTSCEVDDNTTYSAGAGLTLTGATFAADSSYLQRRVTGACAYGSSIRTVNADGTVACEIDDMDWSLTGNAGTAPGTNFLGTTDNQALEFKVNGQRALRLEPAMYSGGGKTSNVIGGSDTNKVDAGVAGATISGGGHNTASGVEATVGGGYNNTASGEDATVAGGLNNTASGENATVTGRSANNASGGAATVSGGDANTASGNFSFAAGRRAKAEGNGSFVWADATDADFTAAGANTFRVRATGGAEFLAGSGEYGLRVSNEKDDSPGDNGDGIRAIANSSQGVMYAALYAYNYGSSPAIYADSKGSYSGYFQDNIYVTGNCVGCTLAYVAVNTGSAALEIGDLVGADGVKSPLTADGQPVLAVSRATAAAFGVMAGRAVLDESVKDDQTSVSAELAAGSAAPGDHLFIIVSGMAQVRVDARSEPIAAGQRLTTADQAGHARAQRTVSIDGVALAEAAPVIGVALETKQAGQGLIWVLVNPQ